MYDWNLTTRAILRVLRTYHALPIVMILAHHAHTQSTYIRLLLKLHSLHPLACRSDAEV
jgi:hypothetical protein